MSVRLRPLLILAFGLAAATTHAKLLRPVPAGILYPMFNQAAIVNPAALPKEKATSVQALFSPGSTDGAANNYEGTVATSTKKLGLGLGYLGSQSTSQTTHSAFAGVGAKWNNISVGMSVQDPDVSSGGFQPNLGVGMIASLKEFDIGAVMYDLNESARGGLGVGFANKRYALEGYILLPPFSTLDNSTAPFLLGVGAGIYGQVVAVSFGATYALSQQNFGGDSLQFFIAGVAWLGNSFNLFARFDSPETFTGGITLVF